ncbi:MAG: LamG domain-containing protein [Clostridia bacterium]|nr:LamG domain-containing protein [Clostridia bacterium]
MKRLLCICLSLWLFAAALPASAAGYRGYELPVITEPEEFSDADVGVYIGEEKISSDKLEWVDNGYEGKALKLSGDGQFLRLGHSISRVAKFSFSAYVNWQGGESGQRLFTVARATQNFLSFSPYMYNNELTADGGCVNGVYLGYQYGGPRGKVVHMFNPAQPGDVTYALPQGEWHHVAVVSDARTMKVYIDGVLWLEEQILISVAELQAHSIDIGSGEWGDKTLSALLDNVSVYRKALSAEEVRELAGVTGGEAYLPTQPPTTTTEPTTTTPPTTPPTTARQTLAKTLWGVPMWGIYTIGGVVAAYAVITLVANILHKRSKRKGEDA